MRLVAMNGSLGGTALGLSDGVTIPNPDADAGSARPCCRIRQAADGFVLYVVDRQMAVFVNGLPVTTRRLELHDELRIADSLFIVERDEPVLPSTLTPRAVNLERSLQPHPVLEVSFDDALLHANIESATREGRDLATLLRVGAVLTSVNGLAALDAALAGLLLDMVPAERIVFAGTDDDPSAVRS